MRKIRTLALILFVAASFSACQKENIEENCIPSVPQRDTFDYETAYAKGRYVFASNPKAIPEFAKSLHLTWNQWGWAINLTQEEIGTTYYKVFAGAALNDISKGEYVASVKIDYDGTKAVITYYLLWGSPYNLSVIHIYARDKKPYFVIPGLFGNTIYGNPVDRVYSKTIDVKDTDGDGVWVIVHSVVYK